MRAFHPGACLTGKSVNFLDATEEEVIDLVRTMVNELAIITCFVAMPPEKKNLLRANIAIFEAYLGCHHSTH